MKNTQLNSGRISDFIPIGQDGQPIYLNAEAFRAALAINPMVGEERVKCLAIPRLRADGQSIDWYVAFPPQSTDGQYHVVTWANATPAERQAALARLHDFEQCLKRLGQDLSRRSGDHKSRLFARYLTGQNSVQNLPAIHFPSHEYVYIVDGIPVITFWGFCSKDDRLDQSPFYSLTQPIPQPAASFAQSAEPAPAAAPYTAAAAPAAAAATTTETRHHCILPTWLLWLLGGLLLLLLLLWLLWWLLPRFGFFGGATSVFDGSYDPPAIEAPVDPTNNAAPAEQLAPNADEISHDQGVLLETVPYDVTAVQDATTPEEVQALLEAPVINEQMHDTQTTNRDVLVVYPDVVGADSGSGSGSATGLGMGMGPDPAAGLAPSTGPDTGMGIGPEPAAGLDPSTGTAPSMGTGPDSGMGLADTPVLDPSAGDTSMNMGAGSGDNMAMDPTAPDMQGGPGIQGDPSMQGQQGQQGQPDAQIPLEPIGNAANGANGMTPPDPLANLTPEQKAEIAEAQIAEQVASGQMTPEEGAAAIEAARAAAANAAGNGGTAGTAGNASGQGNGPNWVGSNTNNSSMSVANPMSFTQQDLAQKGNNVINGKWTTRSGLMDSTNGRPLQLGYEFANGKGQAVVTRPDGTRCVTDVSSVVQGSTVNIDSPARALCADGSSYQVPPVKCVLNTEGQVECLGVHGGKSFPIQFYRH